MKAPYFNQTIIQSNQSIIRDNIEQITRASRSTTKKDDILTRSPTKRPMRTNTEMLLPITITVMFSAEMPTNPSNALRNGHSTPDIIINSVSPPPSLSPLPSFSNLPKRTDQSPNYKSTRFSAAGAGWISSLFLKAVAYPKFS